MPSPYNGYQLVDTDPAYEADREDLQALFRPLFFTSFLLADFLADNAFFGARTAVLSSASSKTSYGTAFLLEGVHRVGLTSAGNVAFTESLGCYDQVLTYDHGDAWRRFVPHVEGWVDVVEGHGPQALADAWVEVLGNTSAPRAGNVLTS